jgi:4-hydroxy-tetrahydrodipicolinate synthase
MSNLRGIWVALVTPFRSGQVDFDALQGLAKKLLNEGVRGLVVCGTTGEAAAMSKDEQLEALDAVLEVAQPGQVIMGLSGNNLQEVLALQQNIQRRDIAGVLVPAPYYIRPSQQGIESYFQAVADTSSVPVVVYDIPYRTGVRIERETLRRIVRHSNIAAVKDCAGDIETTMALINDGHAQVLTGEDIQIFTNLALEVPAPSRHQLTSMLNSTFNWCATWTKATLVQLAQCSRLLPWIQSAFAEPNPAVVKAALSVQGLIANELREPMQPCSALAMERLRSVLPSITL